MTPTTTIGEDDQTAIRRFLEANRSHNDSLALVLFCFDGLLFAALCLTAVLASPIVLQLMAGVAAGIAAFRLVSIGHDAAHQSFTSSRKWNRLIGRLAFLPALQPLATWEVAHNVIHHSWTSIRNKDYVWIPFSKTEYDGLSRSRRLLERIYRCWPGQGLYYFIELWWRRAVLPSTRWPQILRPTQRFDILLVASVAVVWGAGAAVLSVHTGRNPFWGVFCGEGLPFLTLCQLFGWALYIQHTHPRTGFYRDRSSWEFFQAQSSSSTHIEFPRLFDKLLHGFFDHTAHHLDVKVPFYQLRQVESELDRMLRGTNVVIHWSWREFFHTTRVCKLYDYDLHFWLDFEGRPTAYVDGRERV